MTVKKPQYPTGRDEPDASRTRSPNAAQSSSLTWRGFIGSSLAALSVSTFMFPSLNYAETMTTSDAVLAAAPETRQAQKTLIRPFTYRATDSELNDLRRRVAATRLPDREPVSDFSQGVKLATVEKLVHYWATEYDWRKVEARMN